MSHDRDERIRGSLRAWLASPTRLSARDAATRAVRVIEAERVREPRPWRRAWRWSLALAASIALAVSTCLLVSRPEPLPMREKTRAASMVAVPLASGSMLYIPLSEEHHEVD